MLDMFQMKKKKSLLDDESSYFSSYRHNDLEQYRKGYPVSKCFIIQTLCIKVFNPLIDTQLNS